MTLTLNDVQSKLVEDRMKLLGIESPEELVMVAVGELDDRVVDLEDLDDETRAALQEADSEPDLPWEEVRRRLVAKYPFLKG